MIANPSTPPQTTYADIQVGRAFREIGGNDCLKTAGGAFRLDSGAAVTIADTDVVTAAPNATYTMWPGS